VANIKSAQKRHRQSLKRRARNLHVRSTVRNAVKKAREAISGKDPKAAEYLKAAERVLKKAASKGVIHSRNADRHVARLSRLGASARQ
jgi:small subunit ribosomal protein S20